VGGVVFLSVLAAFNTPIFFMTIGGMALVVLLFIMLFLKEPQGAIAEVLPDGTVQMIEVK
jgi:NNP family nitrate/nitrite transporter-like MFS transporter